MKTNKTTDKKGVYYVLLLVFLGFLINGFFLYRYQEENHKLELHKRLLMERLAETVTEYKYMKSENDSLQDIIEKDRKSVLSLMDSISAVSVKRKDELMNFKERVEAMRKQFFKMKVKLDSLQVENNNLALQNDRLLNNNKALTDTNKFLRRTLEKEALLRVSAMSVNAINRKWNNKQEVTHSNFWTDLLRVCYSLGSNQMREGGEIPVYIRVINPDHSVMTSEGKTTEAGDSTIAYTVEQSITYKSNALSDCIDIPGDNFAEGEYQVEIYYDQKLQGVTTLLLD